MTNNSSIAHHVRLVGKLGLGVGIAAGTVLLFALTLITHFSGESYGQIIGAHDLTRQYLGPAMLVAGLAVLSIVGIMTWVIALYSSFLIAGPLYRFSRNLELACTIGPVVPIKIREGDALQKESREVDDALSAVRSHLAALRKEADDLENSLLTNDATAYEQALARFKKLERRAFF